MSNRATGGASHRERRKQEARQRARRRRLQRLAVNAALGLVVLVAAGALVAWWLARDDADDVAGQALYTFDTRDFHSLAFDPDDANRLYFGHHGGLMISDDGGASWRDAALQGVDVMQQSVPADGGGRHYAAGHEVFFVSSDGGATWAAPDTDLPALDIHGFAAAPTDGDRLYAFEIVSRGLYTSADGGATWTDLALPPGMQAGLLPMAVGYDDPLHLFAGVGPELIESKDGGQTWQPLEAPGGTIVSLATLPDDPASLLVGTEAGIWQRGVGGGWARLDLQTDGAVLAIAAHPADSSELAVLDQQGNLYRSHDGGASWGAT